MNTLLRVAKYIRYPFLTLSAILVFGVSFQAAFVVDFAIENGTEQTIVVTPVGTVGPEGIRAPLPVKVFGFPPLPALVRGGYQLKPGESISILYDMDDINFSEIVIETESRRILEFVVDGNPTVNQYHAPALELYRIEKLADLPHAKLPVWEAAQAAQSSAIGALLLPALILMPWLAYGCLKWISSRSEQSVRVVN